MFEMLFGLLGSLFGAGVSDGLQARKQARLRRHMRIQCAARDLAGMQPSLGSRWLRGEAQVSVGHLELEGVDIPISNIDLTTLRRPKGKEAWSISPAMKLVEAANEFGTLELALFDKDVEWLPDQLRGMTDDALG